MDADATIPPITARQYKEVTDDHGSWRIKMLAFDQGASPSLAFRTFQVAWIVDSDELQIEPIITHPIPSFEMIFHTSRPGELAEAVDDGYSCSQSG